MGRLYYILWPSFLVAALATMALFAVVDPHDLQVLGDPSQLSSLATYSIGFLMFWAMGGVSCYLARFLERSSAEINRAASHHALPHGPYGGHI